MGAFIQDSSLVSHRNWSTEESQKSSTWRELAALKFALAAFQGHLSGLRVRCNSDNQYVVRIIQIGSIIKELQENAWGIILFTSRSQIQLDMCPRSKFSGNFFFRKIVDFDDCSVGRLACSYSATLATFNSRFLQPGTETVDAHLVARVLCHMRDCKPVRTLIVPVCKSAQFFMK